MKLKAERQNPGARNQSGKSCRRARVSAVCSSIFAYPRICSYDRGYTSDSARVMLGRYSGAVFWEGHYSGAVFWGRCSGAVFCVGTSISSTTAKPSCAGTRSCTSSRRVAV